MKFHKLTEQYERLLFEETQRETYDAMEQSLEVIANDNKKEFSNTVATVMNNVPDDKVEIALDVVAKKADNIKLSDSTKEELTKETGVDASDSMTFGEFLDAVDISKVCKENPATAKAIITTALTAVALIEPTPIVEIIAAIVAILPDNVVGGIVSLLTINPLIIAAKGVYNLLQNIKQKKSVEEGYDMHDDFVNEYDDDMEIDDKIFIKDSVIKSMNILYGDTSKLEDGVEMEYDDDVELEDSDDKDMFDYDDDLDESFVTAAVSIAKAAGPKLMAVIKRLPEILVVLDGVKDVYDSLPEDNKVKAKLEEKGAKNVEDSYVVVRDLYKVVSPMMTKTSSTVETNAE